MISDVVLIVAEPLAGMSAQRVADALGDGMEEAERGLSVDPLAVEEPPGEPRAWWREGGLQGRLLCARCLVIATARLDERTLAHSLAFELATNARQSGVPTYAVAAKNALDRFDARMLDLQAILEANSVRGLRSAGRQLAQLV